MPYSLRNRSNERLLMQFVDGKRQAVKSLLGGRRGTLLALLVLAGGLAGCASVTKKMTGWFSSNVDAIGVIDGRILRGQATFSSEREATLQLQSSDAPILACAGVLRYTASSSGVIDLSCNDGRSALLVFQPLSPLSGAGRGGAGKAEITLTYGLPPEKAAAYLAVPLEQLELPKEEAAAPVTP